MLRPAYISNEDTRVLEAMAQYDFFARYAVIFLINWAGRGNENSC